MHWTSIEGRDLAALESRLNFPYPLSEFEAHVRTPGYYRAGALLRVGAPNVRMHYIAAGAGPAASRTLFRLNGDCAPIHDGNKAAGIDIRTLAEADAYLRFFCEFLRTDDGEPFTIVEALSPGWIVEGHGRLHVRPPDVRQDGTGRFQAHAMVEHAGMLFKAQFTVQSDGIVAMTDDEPLGPLVRDRAH